MPRSAGACNSTTAGVLNEPRRQLTGQKSGIGEEADIKNGRLVLNAANAELATARLWPGPALAEACGPSRSP